MPPPPHQSQGREVEDDELFGPSLSSSRIIIPKQKKTVSPTSHKKSLRKRPRSHSNLTSKLDSKSSNNHTTSPSISRPLPKHQPVWTILNKIRKGHPFSPTTYDETLAPFINRPKLGLIQGVPRLSTLALRSARFYASKGRFEDFSLIPDIYLYDLLATPHVGPPQLCHLERLNPQRICVFEALWARHVMDTFQCNNLPDGVKWWRELYHRKTSEKNEKFEQARARLRMSYESEGAEKKGKHVERTTSLRVPEAEKKRRRRSDGSRDSKPPTLLQKLRLEVRRDKRRR